MFRNLLLTLWIISLGACSSPATPSPAAPRARVGTSASLVSVAGAWITSFAQAQDEAAIDLIAIPDEGALQAAARGNLDLVLTTREPPPGWFAAPLGREALAVIVHPEVRVRDLELEALRGLFQGRIADWQALDGPSLAPQPVLYLEGDPLREGFQTILLGGHAPPPNTLLAPSAEDMLRLVAQTRGAIGLLPLSLADENVRVLRVEGVLPAESTLASYPLTFTVLAMAPEEPAGVLRDWLQWMQQR